MYLPTGHDGLAHLVLRFPIIAVVAVAFLIGSNVGPVNDGGFFQDGDLEFTALVSITFDDGHKSVLENAFPIMEKYGYKGTAYPVIGTIGEPGYMSWEDLTTLSKSGWEIGSHGMNHLDLTQISSERINYELLVSKHVLEIRGFQVESFATPYGNYNNEVVSLISEYYENHRTAWPAGLNQLPISENDRYLLKAVSADELPLDQVKDWIRKAKEENMWLILVFHKVGESGDYNYSVEDFETIISFLNDNEFKQYPPSF